MKAVAMITGMLLGGMAVCACATAADSLPALGADLAKPSLGGTDLLPGSATAKSGTAKSEAGDSTPEAARSTAPLHHHAPGTTAPRAAGGASSAESGNAPSPTASRTPAQPLHARPVLSWQSLLPGSIQ